MWKQYCDRCGGEIHKNNCWILTIENRITGQPVRQELCDECISPHQALIIGEF